MTRHVSRFIDGCVVFKNKGFRLQERTICRLKIEERNFLCSVAKTVPPGTGPGVWLRLAL
jgi:hypothetical protein